MSAAQNQAVVSADSAGGFVVAWASYGSFGDDSSQGSIQAQRLDPSPPPSWTPTETSTATRTPTATPTVPGASVPVGSTNPLVWLLTLAVLLLASSRFRGASQQQLP